MKVGSLLKSVGTFISKHERILLTGVTIGAEAVAIVEALKEGVTFEKIKEDIKKKKEEGEEVTKKEVFWKAFVPALKVAIPFIISVVAAILNHKKASDTIQSLAGTIILAKEGKDAYEKSAEKVVGKEKADEIKQEAVKEEASKQYKSGLPGRKIIETGHGNTLFYDEFSKQWYRSDKNYMMSIMNAMNEELLTAWQCEENKAFLVNDWYGRNDIPKTKYGDDYMWDRDSGMIEIGIVPEMDESGMLYGIVTFDNHPGKVSYKRHHETEYGW